MPKILYFKYFGCWFCSLIIVLGFLGKFSVWLPRKCWEFFFSCLFMAGFIWIFASHCHISMFLWKEILDFLGEISNNLKIRNAIKNIDLF